MPNEIKQEIYVDSIYHGDTCYITVKVKGKTEGSKLGYEYVNTYEFRTNKKLTGMECTRCEDDKFLDIATERATEHLRKLRNIKKTRFSIFRVFINGNEVSE